VFPLLQNILVFLVLLSIFGSHGLSCKRSGGCIPRYAAVNETVRRALVSGVYPLFSLEPVGVCRNYGKWPDGMSLIPWRQGLPLLWDFTCLNTLAPSNVSTSSRGASRLANSAESAKFKKYSSLSTTFHFPPLCWGLGIQCTFVGAANRLPDHGADWR